MNLDTKSPATLAAGRTPNSFKFAAVNDQEFTETAITLQQVRAVWIARRSRLPLSLAATLAPLAFQEARL